MIQLASFYAGAQGFNANTASRSQAPLAHNSSANTPQFGKEKKPSWKELPKVVVAFLVLCTLNPQCKNPVATPIREGLTWALNGIISATAGGKRNPTNSTSAAPIPQTSGPDVNNPDEPVAVAGKEEPAVISEVAPIRSDSTGSKAVQYGPDNPLNWDRGNANTLHPNVLTDVIFISKLPEPIHTYVLDLVGTNPNNAANYFTVRNTDKPVNLYTAIKVVQAYYKAYGFDINKKDATNLLFQLNGIDDPNQFAYGPGKKIWVKSQNPDFKTTAVE